MDGARLALRVGISAYADDLAVVVPNQWHGSVWPLLFRHFFLGHCSLHAAFEDACDLLVEIVSPVRDQATGRRQLSEPARNTGEALRGVPWDSRWLAHVSPHASGGLPHLPSSKRVLVPLVSLAWVGAQ
jgi:hypothetical protein